MRVCMIFHCPKCKQKYDISEEYLGKKAECENCKELFLIRKKTPQKRTEIKPKEVIKKETDISKPEITATGVYGRIELYPNKICIRRKKGISSFILQGLKGDKDIIISSITSIQLKKAGLLRGYIQFAFMGGKEAKGGMLEATADENTVLFEKEQQPLFEQVKNIIEKRINIKTNSVSPSSDADELAKFADLRDKGVITEEEFIKKKKQILGL